MEIKRTIVNQLVTPALLFCSMCILACGGVKARNGNLKDLLLAARENDDIPLLDKDIKVERMTTALPEQIDEYRIGPNDVLNILVLDHEEFSSARDFNRGIVGTVVKKDGNIYVPIIGKVKASDYTIEEFHKIYRDKLAAYIKDPQLTVDVLKYESQKFYVLGEVNAPGAFSVDGDTTLLEALGMAKGVLPEGNLERAYVIRNNLLLPINLADLLLRGDTSRNIYMKDKDLVYVPNSADQTVYVLGEVPKPGSIQIKSSRLSLAQALAEAGGILPKEADKSNIRLIRGSWQEPTIYTLSYDDVLKKGDLIMLRPGDKIVVEPTRLTVLSRYMEQILPFLLGADHGTATYYRVAK